MSRHRRKRAAQALEKHSITFFLSFCTNNNAERIVKNNSKKTYYWWYLCRKWSWFTSLQYYRNIRRLFQCQSLYHSGIQGKNIWNSSNCASESLKTGYNAPGIYAPPGPGTDRSELVRDFHKFVGPGPVRSKIFENLLEPIGFGSWIPDNAPKPENVPNHSWRI